MEAQGSDMEVKELINKYLDYNGYMRIRGEEVKYEPIFPYIIMDAHYMVFTEKIKKLPVRHELKKMRSRWSEEYLEFNRGLFKAFDGEETDEIIELMDKFEEYIANDMLILHVQVTNMLKGVNEDAKEALAAILSANAIASVANVCWKAVYPKIPNRHLEAICKISRDFLRGYFTEYAGTNGHYDPNNNKVVSDCVKVLCNKIIRWAYED